MKKCVMFVFCAFITSANVSQAENVYFDWPVDVNSYNPYSFGRSLGTINHSGEDILLPSEVAVRSIGDGILVTYKSDGCWMNRLNQNHCSNDYGTYCGYGILYGIAQYTLNRELKVPIGHHSETTNNQFSFVFGHLMKSSNQTQAEHDDTSLTTGNSINKGQIIGYVAPNGATHCGLNDYNGDGAEHLHFGCKPNYVSSISGYDIDTGYCPAHLVIAASRLGVFSQDDTHPEPYWNGVKSEAFSNLWWDEYNSSEERGSDSDNYRYMELDNYHNKLGRPDNNHPNAPSEGTDFVHKLISPTDSNYRVYIQDMYQPYENQSRFNNGHTALILNEYNGENKAYLLKGAIRYFYLNNDGVYNYGMPFTDEIVHSNYADGPYNEASDDIQVGEDTITVQKFRRVYESNGELVLDNKWITPFSDYDNGRRTLVWDGTEAKHFALGELSFYAQSCSDNCLQEGDQIYVADKDNPNNESLDKPWPMTNHPIANGTTGKWFLKPGTYYFYLHDENGHRKSWSRSILITEGNSQTSGDASSNHSLSPPTDFRFAD